MPNRICYRVGQRQELKSMLLIKPALCISIDTVTITTATTITTTTTTTTLTVTMDRLLPYYTATLPTIAPTVFRDLIAINDVTPPLLGHVTGANENKSA